jgi:transcriptional regulator with XRE-family HTH domain
MKRSTKTTTIKSGSDSSRMIAYLKQVFRAHGLRYTDVAALIGVSEQSIKRYMKGRGMTLSVLEQLCAAGGVTLRELSAMAAEGEDERTWATPAQEDVLATDMRMSIVFALISSGWSASRILREGLAEESALNGILVRLDRLGMITLFPGNRFKIRAFVRPFEACSERMRQAISRAGSEVLQSADFASASAPWRLNFARLGPAAVVRLERRMRDFFKEVAELNEQDMDLEGDQVKWYAVCALVREYDPLGLRLLRADLDHRKPANDLSSS